MKKWSFEADYFTACNCDWGCPCTFNARPNEGRCLGWGAWNIDAGEYDGTSLAGTRLALFYRFPGLIEQGNGRGRAYVDSRASDAQRAALEAIVTGRAGGGIFALFGRELITSWLPPLSVPIEFDIKDGGGTVRIGDCGSADTELLSYPDGTVIRPGLDLPHGIEFKKGLATNARRWQWRDEDLLAFYENRYGAVARVRFTEQGCVA